MLPTIVPAGPNKGDRRGLDHSQRISELCDEVIDLKSRLDKQAGILRAMFDLVSESLGITETELLARFQQLESDRIASKEGIMCKQCARPVDLRHNRCLYCGAERQVDSVFELL